MTLDAEAQRISLRCDGLDDGLKLTLSGQIARNINPLSVIRGDSVITEAKEIQYSRIHNLIPGDILGHPPMN